MHLPFRSPLDQYIHVSNDGGKKIPLLDLEPSNMANPIHPSIHSIRDLSIYPSPQEKKRKKKKNTPYRISEKLTRVRSQAVQQETCDNVRKNEIPSLKPDSPNLID